MVPLHTSGIEIWVKIWDFLLLGKNIGGVWIFLQISQGPYQRHNDDGRPCGWSSSVSLRVKMNNTSKM